MSKKELKRFHADIKKAKTEEEVKNAYAKYFDIAYNTSDQIDLYTPGVLFEFKADRNFTKLSVRAQLIAQTMYYIRRLKYGDFIDKQIPPIICLADVDEAILTDTSIWKTFYDDLDEKYDWDLAPSTPDEKLVADITEFEKTHSLHIYKIEEMDDFAVFAGKLEAHLLNQIPLALQDKKVITEDNFESVFNYWNNIFGDAVRNGFKTSRYFVSDIQDGNTVFVPAHSKAIFRIGQAGELKEKKILAKDYEHFWGLFSKVKNIDVIRAILAKIDRLTDETMRRFHGEFFTPLRFAKKSLDYIERTIGKRWWETGEYRLWDMAAGTGNLEYHLPQEALKYCYLSTLYKEDTEHLNRLFSDAEVFQYDYLNDDIENIFEDKSGFAFDFPWTLPQKLRDDLANPKIKWIILINPPFATAQKAGTKHGDSKEGVSDTKLRKQMHKAGLGEVSRELFSQFLYRIKYEFAEKDARLVLFSKIKYINSNNDQHFRDTIFDFKFENGFVFSARNFDGTTGHFPVGLLIWKVNAGTRVEEQNVVVDIFDEDVQKIGTKTITSAHRSGFLSKWINRPAAKTKFPPFGSAIEVKGGNQDKRDRIANNFLASLMCAGNDFQHQNFTALLSGPYVSAGALSVTPENFEKAMVVHAARRIPKATWLNDRDQYMQPEGVLTEEFIADCTVWNLFSNSNQTAALRNVAYEGDTYQVHNQLFPFKVSEVKKWSIADSDIALSLASAEDRFAATWLAKHDSSAEAKAVLDKGREVYRFFFANLNLMRTPRYKIETWDAGWWQIKQALGDVNLCTKELKDIKTNHDRLKEKILPQLREFRIIE